MVSIKPPFRKFLDGSLMGVAALRYLRLAVTSCFSGLLSRTKVLEQPLSEKLLLDFPLYSA